MIKAWLKQVLSALQWDAGARSVAAISPAGDLIDGAGMPALAADVAQDITEGDQPTQEGQSS